MLDYAVTPDVTMADVAKLNGMQVIERRAEADVVFMRLPKALWRPCGLCKCKACAGEVGYWDTLAVSTQKGKDFTWTVHHPMTNGHY